MFMTHNQVVAGSSPALQCSDGKELTQDNAYRNASVSRQHWLGESIQQNVTDTFGILVTLNAFLYAI